LSVDINTDLTINGDLTVFKGGNLIINDNNLDIHIKGNYIKNGDVTVNNSTFHFTGSHQTIQGASNLEFNNLILNSTDEIRIENDILVSGNLDISNSVLNDNGNVVSLEGNVSISNSNHISPVDGSGGLRLAGLNSQQSITGEGDFDKLLIDNDKGVIVHESLRIRKNLILTNGFLDIQDNLLTLLPNAKITSESFSPNQMIKTSGNFTSQGIRIFMTGAGTYLLPIGSGNIYTPVIVVSDNDQPSAYLQIRNHRLVHPAAPFSGNLLHFWNVESNGLSDFTGRIEFTYDQLSVENVNDEEGYIPARLSGSSWIKLADTENLIDSNLNKILFPIPIGSSTISGDYTAGAAIPDVILKFRTISSGNWSDKSIWENVSEGNDPTNVPENGPYGQIIEITEGNSVSTGNIRKIAYQTIIKGTLIIDQSEGLPHLIGNVDVGNDGHLLLRTTFLPIGTFNSFENRGTIEYKTETSGIHLFDPARYPANGVNNIIFSGNGNWRLPASVLKVNNDLEINDNTSLDFNYNNTSLILKGNMKIDPDALIFMGMGTSKITMNGTVLQRIIGDFSGSNSIRNLEINNSNGVIIDGIVELTNSLVFKSGRVFTTSETGILRMLNSSTISGSNFQSYVDGPLQKKGNTRFVFPVGNNNRIGRIAFSPEGIAWANDRIIEARYFSNYTFLNTHAIDLPLINVSGTEYWSLKEVSAGSKSADMNGRVELIIENEEISGITNPEVIRVAWYDPTSSNPSWIDQQGNYIQETPSYVQSNPINLVVTNGYFTFGVDENGISQNPLPIELVSFTAELKNNSVLLEWVTATEVNNDYFTLERSSDGSNYEIIGYIAGVGNSNTLQQYSFEDKNSIEGLSYYRLKQTDFDGGYEYFDPIAIRTITSTEVIESAIQMYPNPVQHGVLNIHLSKFNSEEPIQLILTDLFGRVVQVHTFLTDFNGSGTYTISNLQNEKSGFYFMSVQSKSIRITERIIIK
jgi:hypothetical protein